MNRRHPSIRPGLQRLSIVAFAACAGHAAAQDAADGAPPRSIVSALADAGASDPEPAFRSGTTLYSHGDPSNDEQVLLELMNRARADPSAEADRLFADYGDAQVTGAVDFFIQERPGVEYTRGENRAAFRSYPAKPPFAFNAKLSMAAEKHSQLGVDRDDQSHQYPGELALRQRIEAEGYSGGNLGESVYSYAKSMLYAHAGFAIDWSQSVPQGESRPFPGHRLSLMDYDGTRPYVEVGIGVITESNAATRVGPKVVTIDFGQPSSAATRFVTGVCYEDRNGNAFYDAGEGLEGVRIDSPATDSYTISSASGGYALPVPANAGAIEVTATGEVGGVSEAVGVQTIQVTMSGANVKADFLTPAEPPPPVAQTFPSGAPVALADGAATDATIVVPAFDAAAPTLGDVDVAVTLAHPDASELTLTLVSPAGTQIVLSDRGLPVANLTGTFDSTLAPAGDLGAVAGETYAGTWTLRVADAAGGATGTLTSWSVTVRPAWARGLFAPRTNLALTTFKATDKSTPAADSLRVAGTVDASGRDLDRTAPLHVRLLRADGSEIQRFDVAAAKLAKSASVKTAFALKRTSRATFDVTLRKLDLAAVLPSPVTVEVAIGGAVVRQSVPLRKGAYAAATPAPAPFFRIDSLRATVAKSVMTATVKGRIAGASLPLTGVVEVFLGEAHAKLTPDAFKPPVGTRVTAKTASLFRQMTLDTRTGAFTVVLKGPEFALFEDGRVPFSLRVGPALLGTAEVKAVVSRSTTTY